MFKARSSSIRCPRCSSRRIGDDRTCSKCGWRFEPDVPEVVDEAPPTTIVEIRPDPFERRQVARWIRAAFEVLFLAVVASWVGSTIGGLIGGEIAKRAGDDAFGVAISALIWAAAFGLVGFYSMLRFLSR